MASRKRAKYDAPQEREIDLSTVRPFTERELLKLPRPVFVSGDLHLLNGVPRVAIVGARKASAEGLELARELASQLVAHGVVVVSGLAEGIDSAAHSAAMAAGGRTVAVIGTPTDRAYPAANAEMQRKIATDHLLVSQFARGSDVYPSNFIKRNRTMAVLTHASVIVEASDTSGSLSQASETMELGKPLFFMKGNLGKGLAWPERFRAAGAQVVENVRQIVDSIGA